MLYLRKNYKIISLISIFAILTACHHFPEQDGPPHGHVNLSRISDPIPHPLPLSKYGNPRHYVVHGKKYHVLATARGYHARGYASWYGMKFHKHLTSCREPYDLYAMTAASPVLPIPSFVQVTNLENNKQVIVKVNDRGPFKGGRIMDLSYVAAAKLGVLGKGTAYVDVRSIESNTHRTLPPVTPMVAKNEDAEENNREEKTNTTLFLQVAALSNSDTAENLRSKLQTQFNQPTVINKAYAANKVIYKVLMGPLASTEDSHAMRTKLTAHGYHKVLEILK